MIGPAVRQIVARELFPRSMRVEITDASILRDTLAADTVDMIALALAIEDHFDFAITDAELAAVATVGDFVALVERARQ